MPNMRIIIEKREFYLRTSNIIRLFDLGIEKRVSYVIKPSDWQYFLSSGLAEISEEEEKILTLHVVTEIKLIFSDKDLGVIEYYIEGITKKGKSVFFEGVFNADANKITGLIQKVDGIVGNFAHPNTALECGFNPTDKFGCYDKNMNKKIYSAGKTEEEPNFTLNSFATPNCTTGMGPCVRYGSY